MIVNPIKRRPTRKIRVGSVYVGGDAPISVQSMTNTETCDVDATVAQIQRCADAGADIMRVSVPSMEAAEAFGAIRKRVSVPLVADIHFDHRIALLLRIMVQIVCVLIRVILVRIRKYVKSLLQQNIMVFRFVLG
jgi:(E)-4-hydroxy-3-methylbut-2-enyl-diphosphate synthase